MDQAFGADVLYGDFNGTVYEFLDLYDVVYSAGSDVTV